MKKPKITEGKWSLILEGETPQLGVRNGQINIPVISKLPFETEKQRANAQAIVTAVNNTYGKGIDPEAAGDMKEALIIAEDVMRKECIGYQEEYDIVKQALKKAGVNV